MYWRREEGGCRGREGGDTDKYTPLCYGKGQVPEGGVGGERRDDMNVWDEVSKQSRRYSHCPDDVFDILPVFKVDNLGGKTVTLRPPFVPVELGSVLFYLLR